MDINTWLQDNYSILADAALNISKGDQLHEELLHYSLDQLLGKENVVEIIDSGGANFYTVRIMLNSWRSTTSEFYRIYRRPTSDIDDYSVQNEEPEDMEYVTETAKKIQQEIEKLHWYDRELFKVFVEEGHTMSSLSRVTGIPRTSISLTINRIRKHIKKQLK